MTLNFNKSYDFVHDNLIYCILCNRLQSAVTSFALCQKCRYAVQDRNGRL